MKTLLWLLIFFAGIARAQEQLPPEEKAKDATLILAEKMRDDGWAKISNYEHRDFYYQKNGRIQSLLVQEKIAVLFNIEKREQNLFFNKLSKELERARGIENLSNYFAIINIQPGANPLFILNRLAETQGDYFPKKPAVFLPVFADQNRRQHVALNEIVFKAKTPVRNDLVKERLLKLGKFAINSLTEETPQTYRLVIGKLESPPNIFILANLISEDPWFSSAKPHFNPIGVSLLADLSVSPKGLCGINQQRFLNLTLEIFDETTIVDPKLIPQFGEGDFLPAEFLGEGWLEKEKPIVEQTSESDRKILKITWPFKYFVPGEHHIFNIGIPFKAVYDGQLMDDMVNVRTSFQVSSVIRAANPPIEDIEPLRQLKIEDYLPSGEITLPEKNLGWQETVYRNGDWLAIILLIPATLAALIFGISLLKKWHAAKKTEREAREREEKPWRDLQESVEILEKWTAPPLDWAVVYKMVWDKFGAILQRDFGIHPTAETEEIAHPEIQKIVAELNRIYSDNPPNEQEISDLKKWLREFLKAHDAKKGG